MLPVLLACDDPRTSWFFHIHWVNVVLLVGDYVVCPNRSWSNPVSPRIHWANTVYQRGPMLYAPTGLVPILYHRKKKMVADVRDLSERNSGRICSAHEGATSTGGNPGRVEGFYCGNSTNNPQPCKEEESAPGSYWRQVFGPPSSLLHLLGKGLAVRASNSL
jgi:hypothetical protein